MTLVAFLDQIHRNEAVSFNDTITVINTNYHYQPTRFANGPLVNEAGTNEGSCKIFAFAKLNQLNAQQTLNLFGDYYQLDVLNEPEGTGHQNIRNFMRYGWEGIKFDGEPLTPKQA